MSKEQQIEVLLLLQEFRAMQQAEGQWTENSERIYKSFEASVFGPAIPADNKGEAEASGINTDESSIVSLPSTVGKKKEFYKGDKVSFLQAIDGRITMVEGTVTNVVDDGSFQWLDVLGKSKTGVNVRCKTCSDDQSLSLISRKKNDVSQPENSTPAPKLKETYLGNGFYSYEPISTPSPSVQKEVTAEEMQSKIDGLRKALEEALYLIELPVHRDEAVHVLRTALNQYK